MAITYSIPLGAPTSIAQNVAYALPGAFSVVLCSVACEVAQDLAGPWAAFPAGTTGQTAANFIRCPTGAALVTLKRA